MPVLDRLPAIPPFDRCTHHSSVPTTLRAAVARSGGPELAPDLIRGRPQGRRAAALPWTGASTVASSCRFGMAVCAALVAITITTAIGTAVQAEDVLLRRLPGAATDGRFTAWMIEASRRFGVPVHWIDAVMSAESAGDPRARSPKGAMGLMQIMPATWSELRLRYDLGPDPFDPRASILAGTAYLRELHDRYGWPGVFAAYNSGPARYEEYLVGRPLPAETRAYVATLVQATKGDGLADSRPVFVANLRQWTEAPVFVALEKSTLAPPQLLLLARSDGAFVASKARPTAGIEPRGGSLFVARFDRGAPR